MVKVLLESGAERAARSFSRRLRDLVLRADRDPLLFFAGVIFAAAFRESRQPEDDFGCNVAGIVVALAYYRRSLAFGARRCS